MKIAAGFYWWHLGDNHWTVVEVHENGEDVFVMGRGDSSEHISSFDIEDLIRIEPPPQRKEPHG